MDTESLPISDRIKILRLKMPGPYEIVMVVLKRGAAIDQHIEGVSAEAAVILANLLWESLAFDLIQVFAPDGGKVIDYRYEYPT